MMGALTLAIPTGALASPKTGPLQVSASSRHGVPRAVSRADDFERIPLHARIEIRQGVERTAAGMVVDNSGVEFRCSERVASPWTSSRPRRDRFGDRCARAFELCGSWNVSGRDNSRYRLPVSAADF